jgi:two-component sensor histidine kinase
MLYMLGMNGELISIVTPLAFSLTILLYAYSIFGQRLFDLVPAAREAAFRSMCDGVIVLDPDNRVADINQAALRELGKTAAVIGQPVEGVLSSWPELLAYRTTSADEPCEVMIEGPDGPTWLDVWVSDLRDDADRTYGKLMALRNVTTRKLAEGGLKRSNEALQAEVNERKRAEESLGASLKEKELLLKEIHHRVKNNLQIVMSILSLQTLQVEDPKVAEFCRDTKYRIKSMALIHESLYCSEDLASIDLGRHMRTIASQYVKSYGRKANSVNVSFKTDTVQLNVEKAIPCGLIVTELLSNAFKHGFNGQECSNLMIELSRIDEGTACMSICNDGSPFPECVDLQNPPSMGLQLVQDLVSQIGGTIELCRDGGTTFTVTFPL